MSDPFDLDDDLAQAESTAQAFSRELQSLRDGLSATSRDLAAVERGLASGLRRALTDLAVDGGRLSDALATVGRAMADAVYAAALRPVTDGVAGLLAQGLAGGLAGGVTAFAKGGVVSAATAFPMRGGVGVMGEAGPEAILPLARGPDGGLGVRAGGQAPSITINVATPDVAGFRRSQSQIAAEAQRALSRAARNR